MKGKVIIITILLSIFVMGFARDLNVAYFDSDLLRKEWGEWKDAQAKFDQEVAEWESKAQAMEDTIMQMMEEYQRQELLLSDEKKMEKERLITQKQQEYQEFLSSVFGETGLAAQRNAELTAPLYESISQALAKIAEREGIDVVFDAASSGIAYIDPSLDITDELLKELKNK